MIRDKLREKVKCWTSFYRHFPHKFIKDCLNIDLTFYQSIVLYLMPYKKTKEFKEKYGVRYNADD